MQLRQLMRSQLIWADAGVILENFGCIVDRLIALQAGQSCGSVALASLRRLG